MSTVSSNTRHQKKERVETPAQPDEDGVEGTKALPVPPTVEEGLQDQPYGIKDVTTEIDEVPSHLIYVLNNYCYYHRVFGKDARHCRPPCNFTKKTTSSKKSKKNDKARGGI